MGDAELVRFGDRLEDRAEQLQALRRRPPALPAPGGEVRLQGLALQPFERHPRQPRRHPAERRDACVHDRDDARPPEAREDAGLLEELVHELDEGVRLRAQRRAEDLERHRHVEPEVMGLVGRSRSRPRRPSDRRDTSDRGWWRSARADLRTRPVRRSCVRGEVARRARLATSPRTGARVRPRAGVRTQLEGAVRDPRTFTDPPRVPGRGQAVIADVACNRRAVAAWPGRRATRAPRRRRALA